MAKVPYRTLSKEKRQELRDEICETFLQLPRKEEVGRLLCRLLTQSEQVMLARRIQVAKRLLQGKTEIEIRAELHVGFPLIQSVERWLLSTEEVIERPKKKRKGFDDPYSFTGLRRRYRAKMGLINFLLGD